MFTFHKRRRLPPIQVRKPVAAKDKEQLFGMVRDMKASSLEERFARALDKKKIIYLFRLPIGAPRGMPGWKELDFLVQYGGYYPIQIDDITFVHKGTQAKDLLNDAKIMKELAIYNPFPVKHIPSTSLSDQVGADKKVKDLFG